MNSREAFEVWCSRDNPKYRTNDDSMSNRRDWLVWQASRQQALGEAAEHLRSVNLHGTAMDVESLCAYVVRSGDARSQRHPAIKGEMAV
jgi:hypothetical protein